MIEYILYIAACIVALALLYWFTSKVEENCNLPDEPWLDADPDFESQIEAELMEEAYDG